jgi:hypothetical protein
VDDSRMGYDSATKEWVISHRSDFIALHKKYKWPTDYEDTYIVEAFAESAARYLHSPQTKQALREAMPDVYEYFKKLFQN